MSREAVSSRLRDMARLLDERGFASKGVDMSRSAVTLRLQSMAALSTMCLRLGKATITSLVDKREHKKAKRKDRGP